MNTDPLPIGRTLPDFHKLPGVDGKSYSSREFDSDILIIVFSCNHCPYVQAYEDRMMDLQRKYESKGVQLVAINANEEKNYPDDSFENMVKRAEKRQFNFLYLRDVDQSTAKKFGATHTPQFFVFDRERKLRYSGKMDDNWKDLGQVTVRYVQDALDAIIAGKDVKVSETFSVGCTIKWK